MYANEREQSGNKVIRNIDIHHQSDTHPATDTYEQIKETSELATIRLFVFGRLRSGEIYESTSPWNRRNRLTNAVTLHLFSSRPKETLGGVFIAARPRRGGALPIENIVIKFFKRQQFQSLFLRGRDIKK